MLPILHTPKLFEDCDTALANYLVCEISTYDDRGTLVGLMAPNEEAGQIPWAINIQTPQLSATLFQLHAIAPFSKLDFNFPCSMLHAR